MSVMNVDYDYKINVTLCKYEKRVYLSTCTRFIQDTTYFYLAKDVCDLIDVISDAKALARQHSLIDKDEFKCVYVYRRESNCELADWVPIACFEDVED